MWNVGFVGIGYRFFGWYEFLNQNYFQTYKFIRNFYFFLMGKSSAFQGSGLEILIFCAFSATFFVAACTVSLCRRPRTINIPAPPLTAVTTNVNDIEIAHLDQHEPHVKVSHF